MTDDTKPTYRITTEHAPDAITPNIPWQARIVRLSDGEAVATKYGPTEEYVLEEATAAIRALSGAVMPGHVYFATDDGDLDPVPEPQSLRGPA